MSIVKQLPDLANPPATTPEEQTGMTLRTTTRLVDVTLVAYDKKGHPVATSKPADLEVYDNGRKEEIRFFNPVNAEAVPAAGGQLDARSGQEADLHESIASGTCGCHGAADLNSTILMIDASNVAFSDLTRARAEMLRFLKTLAIEQQVGLYILRSYGVEILAEPTPDHARVATMLQTWMPNAQDLARAQDEERRNRQQFDWVHSVTDLANVNGNGQGGNDPEMYASGGAVALPPRILQTQNSGRSGTGRRTSLCIFWLEWAATWQRFLATRCWFGSQVTMSLPTLARKLWGATGNRTSMRRRCAPKRHSTRRMSAFIRSMCRNWRLAGVGADIGSRNVLAMGKSGRDSATSTWATLHRDSAPAALTAQMQADTHPIQGTFRDLADATGGRAMRRAGDIAAELNNVVADGRAAYLLSFSPDSPADDQYHAISVKATARRDLTLHYRTGYVYSKDPATFKDRFKQAIWDPRNINEIVLTVSPVV